MLALRTWLRYVLPLTIVSALVHIPVLRFAWKVELPKDAAAAKSLLVAVWLVAGTAWITQLVLVAAAAPAARSLAAGTPLAQWRALVAGLANVVRMVLPIGCVVAAVLVGGMALVVPGVLLLGLLALTAASTEPGLPAPLLDSVAVVRKHWRPVAIAMGAILVIDLALAALAYLVLADPLPKKPAPAQLAAYRDVARAVTVGLAILSPLAASVLAAIRVRAS
jgi:hypothetical protein